MTEITVYDKNGNSIDNLVQWDTGVVIYISERYITSAQKVHFFTPESEEAYVMNSSYSNGKLSGLSYQSTMTPMPQPLI